jgi:hypothetical protein
MTRDERPLPTPPRSRFGKTVPGSGDPGAELTADRMAQAAAEGRLEEFLQQGIPEGEHARNLAMMMMGMSGMMPMGALDAIGAAPAAAPAAAAPPQDAAGAVPAAVVPAAAPDGLEPLAEPPGELPPGVAAAVRDADVASLAALLQAEHAKRFGPGALGTETPAAVPAPPAAAPQAAPAARPGIDAAIVDELIRIGAENDVSVDWLMLRAVKLYVEEHRKTGRL